MGSFYSGGRLAANYKLLRPVSTRSFVSFSRSRQEGITKVILTHVKLIDIENKRLVNDVKTKELSKCEACVKGTLKSLTASYKVAY
jgi:aspartokinase-like uncharacterized kinase